MLENILPEFQKFLAFSNTNENLDFSETKQKFLEQLSNSAGIADWQKEQAEIALKLYFEQFNKDAPFPNWRRGRDSNRSPDSK